MALCGMKAISRQRSAFMSRSESAARSRPSNSIRPPLMKALSAMTRVSARATVVLPQPDSPTRPTIEPRGTSKLTPSTASREPRPTR